ncbi:MAG: hypothetical protein CUN54_05305 [Phototrophicales bacterium]|nr:MAG: hypothetical protein CUN54_05305 [Phototrophicales bacterium]
MTIETEHSRYTTATFSGHTFRQLIYQRSLNALPGTLVWVVFVLSVLGSRYRPRWMLTIAALLVLYLAVRFCAAGLANIIGLRRIRSWERIDWQAHYTQFVDVGALAWDDIHHIVIIPNYNEPLSILKQSLDALAAYRDAHERLTIVLAMEADEVGSIQKAQELIAAYHRAFAGIFYTTHPDHLPGEIRGKSANLAWAFTEVKQWLLNEVRYNLDCVIVTVMDSDTLWHEHYFDALTYHFAIHHDRYHCLWQAPIRYHGNIWSLWPVLRPLHAYATAFELAYSAAPWWTAMPMSSYSLSYNLLNEINAWDTDVIADEWHVFIKAYFMTGGRAKVEPIMLPFRARVVTGATWWETAKNRYHQSVRHAWGSKEIGYTIDRMLHTDDITWIDRYRLLVRVSHDLMLSSAGWGVLTIGSQLPLVLHSDLRSDIFRHRFDHPEFVLIQIAFAIITVLGILFWIVDIRERPPRSRPSLRDRMLEIISLGLLPIMSFVFVALPMIYAQTQMIFRHTIEFRVTTKE